MKNITPLRQKELCKLKAAVNAMLERYNEETWEQLINSCNALRDVLDTEPTYYVRGHHYKPYVNRTIQERYLRFKCVKCNHDTFSVALTVEIPYRQAPYAQYFTTCIVQE